MESEIKKENWQNKILDFLNQNSNFVLIAILIFALILRLKYLTINQAVWFDEAVYLDAAKNWALGFPPFQLHFVRPALLPFILAGFYKLGAGELAIRIFILISSIVGVFFTYLVGKELFNKRIALISTFIMSFFYMSLFYTARILTGVPTTTIWLISIWLFWKGYIKNGPKYYLWLLGFFMFFGILMRFPFGLLAIVFLVYLLTTEGFKFLKNKHLWIGTFITFLGMIPYFIWYYTTYDKIPILGSAEFYNSQNLLTEFLNFMPTLLQSPIPGISSLSPAFGHFFILALIIGFVVLLFNLTLGWDLIRKNIQLKKHLLAILWLIIPFIYFAFFLGIAEDRYLFYIFPVMFYIIGWVFMKLYDLIKRYNALVGLVVILLILFSASFTQLQHADGLIKFKSESYIQFKWAGEWIKENSQPTDKIIAAGEPQLTYYSERDVVYWPSKQEGFEKLILEDRTIKFMVLSQLEGSPKWSYKWPPNNPDKVIPVQAYFLDEERTKPSLIIYQFGTYQGQ